MDASEIAQCERTELNKLGWLVLIGAVLVAVICAATYFLTPPIDPITHIADQWSLVRSILFKAAALILGVVAMVAGVCGVNWVTRGDWWIELEEKQNIAVGIATGGLFIGIGLIVFAAM